MRLCVLSYKGGVGKTSISYSLAIDLGLSVYTNDYSSILSGCPKAKMVSGEMPIMDNVIYDFGGFKDSKINAAIRACDCIIVPTIPDINSVQKTLQVLMEFKDKNILVVGNMIESEKDKNDIEKIISTHFPNTKFLHIKRGKLFKKAMEERLSPVQLYNKDNLSKHIFNSVFKDYLTLLKEFV